MFYKFIINNNNNLSKNTLFFEAMRIAKLEAKNHQELSELEVFLYKNKCFFSFGWTCKISI